MPISLCTLLDSNVTEPFQPFAFHQASRHKINTAEATYQPHIYSIILHPSAPFLHLPSILTSCPLKPVPFAPLPQSLFPHVLTRSHSLSLPPLFLSIHTTESLLIICDLLKYIHCQSLSFPLSLTHFAFPLALSLALSLPGFLFGKPPCITHSLSLSTFSFFCLSVLQDNLSPPLHLLFVPQRSHKHCETWLAGALAWALAGREGWTLHFTAQTGPWAQ